MYWNNNEIKREKYPKLKQTHMYYPKYYIGQPSRILEKSNQGSIQRCQFVSNRGLGWIIQKTGGLAT